LQQPGLGVMLVLVEEMRDLVGRHASQRPADRTPALRSWDQLQDRL
jgi:hypothetical protein